MGIETIALAALAAGTATSIYNGIQQKNAASYAARQAKENADKQEKQAQEAQNRANQKRADTAGILDAAMQSGKAGASGTMLTGPQGIDPAALNLSKNTLLGS